MRPFAIERKSAEHFLEGFLRPFALEFWRLVSGLVAPWAPAVTTSLTGPCSGFVGEEHSFQSWPMSSRRGVSEDPALAARVFGYFDYFDLEN